MNQVIITAVVAVSLYIYATMYLGKHLSHGGTYIAHAHKSLFVTGSLAAILHAILLYQGIVVIDGVNLGFFNALSLLGWVIVTVLIISAFFEPVISLGVIMFPGAALTLALMILFPTDHILVLQMGWPMKVHVLSSILAYSLFALAAVQVIMLMLQERALRQHKPLGFTRSLPPLQTMETLLFRMISAGFIILSFSLLTGAIYITDMLAQHLAHKTVLSLLAWLVFGTLLWGRWKYGWRSRKAFAWTVSGFIVLGLAYPVTKFILEVILNY